ncbi:DUF4129 domain-containing protein [Kribbella sp. NPDC051770]|uniref:DUF4129 domain-containing protein n=1 Tax=Kribbella sp. NPDC051770 TaxID=3155413 RepID=UPI003449E7F8
MQPTRRSVVAVVAALVLGVGAVVLVVFASAGGSVQPVSESTRTAAPRTPPTFNSSQSVVAPTPSGQPTPKDIEPIEMPEWLKALWTALVYAAGVLLVLFLLRVVYRILRKVELPQGEDDDTDWERVKVDRLAEAVESGLSTVDSGTATDAVIACWVALEEAAASAGVAREPSETPAEFTVRVLGVGGISEPELLRLAQLYREARYSTHGSTEEARTQARAALLSLREELAAAVAAR